MWNKETPKFLNILVQVLVLIEVLFKNILTIFPSILNLQLNHCLTEVILMMFSFFFFICFDENVNN
jgi:hypothetical protein